MLIYKKKFNNLLSNRKKISHFLFQFMKSLFLYFKAGRFSADYFQIRGKKFFVSILVVLFSLLLFSATFAQEDGDDEEEDPVKIFNEGQEAHERGDFEAALKLYEKALEIVPEFPEAEYQRGNALLSLGNPVEAEEAFRSAINLRENWTLPMTSLGVLLVQNNKFEEAEQILTKTIQLSGINFLAYSALTDLRIRTGAAPEVLRQLLTKVQYLTTKANPTASIWASRAALERALGDKKSAIGSLSRALSIDPFDKSALAERAELSLSEGDYKSALEDAGKLKQMSPDSANVNFLLARIYASKGDLEESVKILDTIKNPTAEILTFRDKINASSSQNVGELEKQLEKDEKNAAILGRLCNLLRVENPQKSLNYCRRASEAEPNNLNHAIGFGAALVSAKQYVNAITLFKRLLEISPDNFTARTNLATALFQAGRFAEAKSEFIWITKKQPDLAIAYYFLAITHDNLQEYLDAAANYQQFLRIADEAKNKLEIEKVNLRLPGLQRLIKQGKGKKK